jgi:hypothetical protein
MPLAAPGGGKGCTGAWLSGAAIGQDGGVTQPDIRAQWNANAAAWTELSRAGLDRYRDLVNTPAFFRLLPPVDGLACLDLGCTGLIIEAIAEPRAGQETAAAHTEVADTRLASYFLIVRARKP